MRKGACGFARSVKAASGLALCLLAAPAAAAGDYDGGGRVGDYLDRVAAADGANRQIAIHGVCASACTIKLGASRVCIEPQAQLLFHAARNADGGVNALGTLVMLQEYPRAIRDWAIRHGALRTTQLTGMSGAEAIALGVPRCAARVASALPSRPGR